MTDKRSSSRRAVDRLRARLKADPAAQAAFLRDMGVATDEPMAFCDGSEMMGGKGVAADVAAMLKTHNDTLTGINASATLREHLNPMQELLAGCVLGLLGAPGGHVVLGDALARVAGGAGAHGQRDRPAARVGGSRRCARGATARGVRCGLPRGVQRRGDRDGGAGARDEGTAAGEPEA